MLKQEKMQALICTIALNIALSFTNEGSISAICLILPPSIT